MKRPKMEKRLEKLEEKHAPKCTIGVNWRTDGMIENELPDGTIELITEAEFIAKGGRLVYFGEPKINEQDAGTA